MTVLGRREMEIQTPPAVAGRYRIIQPLGEGGLGAVYYAWDEKLQRPIALKRLHRRFDEDFQSDDGWREANVLASLQHPGIVTLYDFGEDENGPYFIMEYLAGQTLDKAVEHWTPGEVDAYDIARQSLQALQAAHQKGVVHRDIKPPNLMLVPSTNGIAVKILDFGLAKFQQEPQKQTMGEDRSIMGSIHFIAPEQFSGDEVDARSDLYSLGNVLYYALTGKTAHDGRTITEIIASHLYKESELLSLKRPDLSAGFVQWLDGLMQRDPAARPKDAGEALRGLHDWGATRPTPVRSHIQASSGRHLQPAPANNSRWTGIVILLIFLALSSCLVLFFRPGGSKGKSTVSTVRIPDPEPPGQSAGAITGMRPLSSGDLARLRERDGQQAVVEGVVQRSGVNRSGTIYYLNFDDNYREALALVFFPSDFEPMLKKEKLDAYVGKKIRAQGTIETYRDTLQMRIRSLEQIRIIE